MVQFSFTKELSVMLSNYMASVTTLSSDEKFDLKVSTIILYLQFLCHPIQSTHPSLQ